ncbi:MAG TPA: M20 family metallo-hydrolase [Flavitalea sp.]|nr:M20 family metallo-hydrolase [Flavitalea sp.]
MVNNTLSSLSGDAVDLLRDLIRTPSFSRQEDQTASLLTKFLGTRGIEHSRIGNNVFARNRYWKEDTPVILLNSHHDTVKPNSGYKNDPFSPEIREGKLFGLGSNDAGGSLVALLAAFLNFYEMKDLTGNLLFAATAEEEISGSQGIESLLPHLGTIHSAIVGEPTKMQLAVAERGLMVLDCTSKGRAGHAARNEGENAIYRAMTDIEWFRSFQFPRNSTLLGPVKLTITSIHTENKAHNVVPDSCHYIVDVRVNEHYSFEEILQIITAHVSSEITPRSTRLRSTLIKSDHPLVKAGVKLGKDIYGSPTTSDKALMPFPALKIGPGDSARSHTPDEFIFVAEITEGIDTYIQLLNLVLHETLEQG